VYWAGIVVCHEHSKSIIQAKVCAIMAPLCRFDRYRVLSYIMIRRASKLLPKPNDPSTRFSGFELFSPTGHQSFPKPNDPTRYHIRLAVGLWLDIKGDGEANP
jgi:hypothetical protein